MTMALDVLQTMADRGNSYIRACHGLLNKIRGAIKPNPPKAASTTGTSTAGQAEGDALSQASTLMPDLVPDKDQGLPMDFEDDPMLWAEVLDSMNIDMDRQWVETAFRRGQQLEMPDAT